MTSRKRSVFGLVAVTLVLLVVLAAGGYAWTWFHYARQLETVAQNNLEALRAGGREAKCPDMTTGGFPLGMRISCDGFVYRDPETKVSVETGPIESAARVYDPLTLTGRVVAPAVVALPNAPTMHFTWQELTAHTRLAQPLPERLDLAATDIAVSLQQGGERLLHMASLALAARPQGEDLDVTLDFTGLALGQTLTPEIDLPALDGTFDIEVDRGVPMLIQPPQDLRGISATIDKASLSSGEAAVELSGPVRVGEDGLVDASLSITIRKPQQIATLLADALPDKRDEIETAFQALAMLGDGTTLPLRIDKGKAYIGFIKIGDVPRL